MNEVEVQNEKVRSGRQRSDKRVRIVDAAVAVFAEKGYRSARISDIARRAGVADGTIYLYFRNKEDLLLTIFEEKMDGILNGLRAAVDGIDAPAARMRAFARFHFEQMRLQVIYTARYCYESSPIERLFAALKLGELNPVREPTGKR